MTDEDRLRAVETSAVEAHGRMDAHEKLCSILGKQTKENFAEVKDDLNDVKNSLKTVSKYLFGVMASLLVATASVLINGLIS